MCVSWMLLVCTTSILCTDHHYKIYVLKGSWLAGWALQDQWCDMLLQAQWNILFINLKLVNGKGSCVVLLGVFSLLEVAHWARVEYSLSFISWSSLLRGVCHLIVSTFGAATLNLTINMVGKDRSNDNCILLTIGPSPSLFNFSFSLLSANTLQEYSTSFSNSTHSEKKKQLEWFDSHCGAYLTFYVLFLPTHFAHYFIRVARQRKDWATTTAKPWLTRKIRRHLTARQPANTVLSNSSPFSGNPMAMAPHQIL